MKGPDDQLIENLLRTAPQPRPPQGLKGKLIMQARSFQSSSSSQPSILARPGGGWFRRWWPVLVPAGFSLVCAVVLAVQQQEIWALKKTIQTLSGSVVPATPEAATPAVAANDSPVQDPAAEAQEIARLQELVGKLTGEISELEKMRTENQGLRARLSATQPGLSAEETDALAKAREKAETIRCVNNMKQLGLAVRIWAGDNADRYPPDIVCMSNVMNTPKILVCPTDKGHVVAPNFDSFTAANCSYEWFLNPSGSDTEPTRVMTRCPIHGTVGLYDGSVHMGAATNHPEGLIQRDGRLYYEPPSQQ
jgi:hypothetical protein